MESVLWEEVLCLLKELEDGQRGTLFELGRRIVPTLTQEDLLQPNDYPELENQPHFRYEEGVLAGIQTAQMALQALRADLSGGLQSPTE